MKSKKTIQWIARVLFVWMSTVWPAQIHLALAQSVPQIPNVPTGQYDIQNAVTNRKEDVQTESTQINRRAQKLSNGWVDPSAVRSAPINATTDGVPVRSPNSTTNDTPVRTKDPITVQDSVTAAQRGSDLGQQIFNSVPRPDPSTVSFEKPGPDNKTQPGKVNIREIVPSYTNSEVGGMIDYGRNLYNDPSQLKQWAESNEQSMKKSGCRKTDIYLLEKQNITQAQNDSTQRILKIEFFNIKKDLIPNTNPPQYNITYTRTNYNKGAIKLSFPTLGGTEQQWWEMVGDDYAILYTYTPYTQPKNRNYFTYSHQIAAKTGGTISVYSNAIASYGSTEDGFTTVPSVQIPYGVDEVYLSADLYRTQVNYYNPGNGQSCPPDPPNTCEVQSIGGDVIRWCGNSPGANIYNIYDDSKNPSDAIYGNKVANDVLANAQRKDYRTDSSIRSAVNQLYTAPQRYSQDFAGRCERVVVSSKTLTINTSFDEKDIHSCTEALINPYPNGCPSIKRSFGLSYLADQNFLTVRAYQKIKQPIIDPKTGKQALDSDGNPMWTYIKQPANVSGAISINIPVIGASVCPLGNTPTGNCSTESVPDREEYILEYSPSPATLDPNQYVVNGVYVAQGGSASVTHYGRPTNGWTPVGSAFADGTYAQVRLMAKIYQVTVNQFSGCSDYLNYIADGICTGAKLTCIDSAPTRTVGGVTFGPSLPNSGIVDVLKAWGVDNYAVFPDYTDENISDDDTDGGEPYASGSPINLLNDKMCWEAKGEPFTSCSVIPNEGNVLTQFTRNGQIWATDCDKITDSNGSPINSSSLCKRATNLDECDSRWVGLFSMACYNQTIAYDCGTRVENQFDYLVDEKADVCSGSIRCMGTECHRPNLTGDSRNDFIQVAAQMESLNMAAMDMVCSETGKKPTSATQKCTPLIFGGTSRYCKIPIGSNIGLTPNCCTEAKKAAKQTDVNWVQYLELTMASHKILTNDAFKKFVFDYSTSYPYTAASQQFGEISQPITDMYRTASDFVQNSFVKPFSDVVDNVAQKFRFSGTTAIDSAEKGVNVFDFIGNFQQEMYKQIYNTLPKDLADMVFSQTASGEYVLQLLPSAILLAFEIYSWLSILGHIIFACKEEEFQWGIDNKLRLCAFAGTCCSKKVFLIGCIEKRQLYCCYKSIAARVIAEQIINKNLDAKHRFGFRTKSNGKKLKKCSINCAGFSPDSLANVDWSQIDLSEWTDALVQSGILNPANLQSDFGVTPTGIQQSNAMARQNIELPQFDQSASSAEKNLEILQSNVSTLTNMTQELKTKVPCYVDSKKMPMYDPSCDQNLINQGNN